MIPMPSMSYLTISQGFLILILVLLPVIVYIDATDHRIGEHSANVGSRSAGAWAFWALIPVVGPVIAYCYFMARKDLVRQAKLYPSVVPANRRDLTYFFILAGGLISYGVVV